jgi:hypothetical protein
MLLVIRMLSTKASSSSSYSGVAEAAMVLGDLVMAMVVVRVTTTDITDITIDVEGFRGYQPNKIHQVIIEI